MVVVTAEKDGTFTFYDKEGKVTKTLTSPDAKDMELTGDDTLFDDDYGTKPSIVADVNTQAKDPSILETARDKDLGLKQKITTSREYDAYKKIQPLTTAGQQLVQGEEIAQANYQAALNEQSDYFKEEASSQLYGLTQQNYAQVMDMPQFVDYSNFNPSQDPARQYLAYRGITDYVNPLIQVDMALIINNFTEAQLERLNMKNPNAITKKQTVLFEGLCRSIINKQS